MPTLIVSPQTSMTVRISIEKYASDKENSYKQKSTHSKRKKKRKPIKWKTKEPFIEVWSIVLSSGHPLAIIGEDLLVSLRHYW